MPKFQQSPSLPKIPDGRELLKIYDLPSGGQIHLHNDSAAGNIQKVPDLSLIKLDAYQSALIDYMAQKAGLKSLYKTTLPFKGEDRYKK